MIHQGYNLKVAVRQQLVTVDQLSKVLGVSRQGVNGYYGKEEFAPKDIELLNKAGPNIPGVTAPGGIMIGEDSSYKKELEMMKLLLASKEQTIRALETALAAKK